MSRVMAGGRGPGTGDRGLLGYRRPQAPGPRPRSRGFTLIEVLLGGFILIVAVVALLGAFLGQQLLNANARNLTAAMTDATRVMEQIRQQNTGCTTPSVTPPQPAGTWTSWDAWLADANGAGGRSLAPSPPYLERIVLSCQNEDGTAYCNAAQVGAGEWVRDTSQPDHDPLRVTVSVCWRHRERVVGECAWSAGAPLVLTPQNGSNGPNTDPRVIESPAMLTTLVTCRQ